jgi:hypothetical protein
VADGNPEGGIDIRQTALGSTNVTQIGYQELHLVPIPRAWKRPAGRPYIAFRHTPLPDRSRFSPASGMRLPPAPNIDRIGRK